MSNILVVSKVRNKILGFQFEENKLSRIYNLENKSLVGNIYVGYVKDIVKNLNAAFVEIDGESKGFLPEPEGAEKMISFPVAIS